MVSGSKKKKIIKNQNKKNDDLVEPNTKKQSKSSKIAKPNVDLDKVMYHLERNPFTEEMAERYAKEFMDYVTNNEDVVRLDTYRLTNGIPRTTYSELLVKFPVMKVAHEYCREIIGERRERILADDDPKFLKYDLYQYSHRRKRAEEFKAKLRDDNKEKEPVTVVFKEYPKENNENNDS